MVLCLVLDVMLDLYLLKHPLWDNYLIKLKLMLNDWFICNFSIFIYVYCESGWGNWLLFDIFDIFKIFIDVYYRKYVGHILAQIYKDIVLMF